MTIYRQGVAILVAAFVIIIAIIVMVKDPRTQVARKEPSCADCDRHCAPYRVTLCVPSGLGPRCECQP